MPTAALLAPDPAARTVAYYDAHAAEYEADTAGIAMEEFYRAFLAHVPAGGRVLDAGCGPGRDVEEFVRRGYAVSALDASRSMVRRTRERTGVRAVRMRLEEIDAVGVYDGIWANSSLLHVDRRALPGVVARLARALRRGGALYVSFKEGDGERMRGGLPFTDFSPRGLAALLRDAGLAVARAWAVPTRSPPSVHAVARA